jgi:hypothetical protein
MDIGNKCIARGSLELQEVVIKGVEQVESLVCWCVPLSQKRQSGARGVYILPLTLAALEGYILSYKLVICYITV